MKRVLLISPYFTPSNIACVVRSRVMARGLPAFGWQPTIITVEPRYYEETSDSSSLALLPPDLSVERVSAWPAKICRALGFGDVSIRAQWSMRRKLAEFLDRGNADLVFVTVLPGYTSLVGVWAKQKFNVPFVLDYQDPWVGNRNPIGKTSTRLQLSQWIAKRLEPGAIAAADALTAVSAETLGSARDRGLIRPGIPVEVIPIGMDAQDHLAAAAVGQSWIKRSGNEFIIAYIGTIIGPMLESVRTLFRAVQSVRSRTPDQSIAIHFVGTSGLPDGEDTNDLAGIAHHCGVQDIFHLEPHRIGYLDALRTMQEADVLLLIGSTDSHYTASKLFPYWLAGKPILGLFHVESSINQLAAELGGVRIVTYDNCSTSKEQAPVFAEALQEIRDRGLSALSHRNDAAFERYSPKGIGQKFAALFDRVLSRPNRSG